MGFATAAPQLRFGLSLPNRAILFGMPIDDFYRAVERAEASGIFDSVWVGDNFLSKPRLEAIVTLSALASRTHRLRLGVVCLATFAMRHPLLLALQWASLDVVSGGRTILAVCLGGFARSGGAFAIETAATGIRDAERIPRLTEGISLLRALWGPDPVTHHGQFYDFEGVELYPKPIQRPVPIIIAVNPTTADKTAEERALRRVARIADGWQTDGTPADVFESRWRRVREYALEFGRANQLTDASLHMMVNINQDAEVSYAETVAFLDRYYGVGAISSDKLQDWLAHGDPAAVIAKIRKFVDAGCTTVIVRFTSSDQLGQLDTFINEVAPAFRSRLATSTGRIPV